MPAQSMSADLKCPKCGYALAGLPSNICPECGIEFTPALLEHASRRARLRRWIISFLVMASVVYAPFGWLLLLPHLGTEERLFWLKLWPILPGLPVTLLLRSVGRLQLPNWGEFVCMGAFTLLVLLLFTWLGTRGKRWLIITATIVLALSCYNGWIGYVLYQL